MYFFSVYTMYTIVKKINQTDHLRSMHFLVIYTLELKEISLTFWSLVIQKFLLQLIYYLLLSYYKQEMFALPSKANIFRVNI